MGESLRSSPPGAVTVPAAVAPGVSAVSPAATAWAITLLTAMNLLNYIDRYVLPANIETVRRDIPMTDTEQGIALTAFIWVYMAAAPIFGRLGDTRTRKYLVGGGVALWSVATAAASLAHSLGALLAARAFVGIGEAAYATMAPSLIGDYYPEAKRGRIMAVFYVATPVGSALGYVLGGKITQAYSWRDAFLAVGIPGLLIAALALTIREPPRGQFDATGATGHPGPTVHGSPSGGMFSSVRKLMRLREYVWTVAGYTAYTFGLGGLSQWMPTYLQRIRHLEVGHANGTFGTITVVAGLAGTAVGGAIGEALRGRVRHPYILLSALASLAAVPFCALAFTLGSTTAMWLAVFAAEFLVFLSTGPVNTTIINCLPPSLRTSGFAFSILSIHLLGDAISPTIIGAVSDRSSLPSAVMLVPVALAVGAGLWLYAWRTLPVTPPAPAEPSLARSA